MISNKQLPQAKRSSKTFSISSLMRSLGDVLKNEHFSHNLDRKISPNKKRQK
jgi:hypothetical protein